MGFYYRINYENFPYLRDTRQYFWRSNEDMYVYIYIEDIQINTDPENSLILVETNLPTLVWQGLC